MSYNSSTFRSKGICSVLLVLSRGKMRFGKNLFFSHGRTELQKWDQRLTYVPLKDIGLLQAALLRDEAPRVLQEAKNCPEGQCRGCNCQWMPSKACFHGRFKNFGETREHVRNSLFSRPRLHASIKHRSHCSRSEQSLQERRMEQLPLTCVSTTETGHRDQWGSQLINATCALPSRNFRRMLPSLLSLI